MATKKDDRIERDLLEEAQTLLLTASVDLDEVALRVRQAIRRTRLVADVLDPASERIERVRGDLKLIRQDLSEVWRERNQKKWRGD